MRSQKALGDTQGRVATAQPSSTAKKAFLETILDRFVRWPLKDEYGISDEDLEEGDSLV